jgi:hypothetical protein
MIASISTLAARFAPSSSSFDAVGAEHCAAGDDAATTSSLVLRALALERAARAGVVLATSRRGVCTSAMRGGDGGGDDGRRRAVRLCARVRAQLSSRRKQKKLFCYESPLRAIKNKPV